MKILDSRGVDSPLVSLSPTEKPDCNQLLNDLRAALNRASALNLFPRMELNHRARFAIWDGQDPSCLKRMKPGGKRPQPWPDAADLRVRLVDGVIMDYGDLLAIAESRVVPQVLPLLMDPNDEQGMERAADWGGVFEYYQELSEYDVVNGKSQWKDIAWEYGHGIMYCGWAEERQMVKRTIDADTVAQLVAMATMMEQQAQGMPMTAEAQQQAAAQAELLVMDKDRKPDLIATLRRMDPDMTEKEARRVAGKLRGGKPVDYFVPVIVRAMPEVRALTPGVDVFYPYETVSVQRAQFVVMPEWWSDVEMRANVTTRGWDSAAVEKVIEKCKAGRAAFWAGLAQGTTPIVVPDWFLTGGMIGLGVTSYDFSGEQSTRLWQMVTVCWRATDPDTGVPVLYRTTFHPDLPEFPVFHGASLDNHAKYPFVEYKREQYANTLWSSRGVGEISVSEQEELRFQANFCFDNAAITIKPPYEINARSDGAVSGLGPGQRVLTPSSGMNAGVKKIDIGGDARWSLEVQRNARGRSNEYWKTGVEENMNPIAQQNAHQARVNDWVLAVKMLMKMMFATIQQHMPGELRVSALNGRRVNLQVTREEIQGELSVLMEYDVANMDPKSVEARAKMVREMVAPLDREGLLQVEPLLRMLMMSINPTWGRLIVANSGAARQAETDKAVDNMVRVLNGVEGKYLSGGNPRLRAEVMQRLAQQPAIDDKGQPIVDEASGQMLPGRAAQILMTNPDAKALFDNLMKHEVFEAEQQDNVEVGRKGVKMMQEGISE